MFMEQSGLVVRKLAATLLRRKLLMCAAESCTGGLIATVCTNEPGSSSWFNGGIVSYSNAMKTRLLKVPEATLQLHGAVSLAVVERMACGAARACVAQCAIAVSGIAGPDGGTADKPVGTVCLAVALPAVLEPKKPPMSTMTKKGGLHIFSISMRFQGNRIEVRQSAALCGLEMLLRALG